MARFKDRHNLFSGKLRVAPRPFVPPHWDVPEDYPSATRFWVHPQTGATSSKDEGAGWTFSESLKQWHLRQAERVWASRRMVERLGLEEAEKRAWSLQTELNRNIRTANSYLDLLISIDYEACRLTRRAEIAEQLLIDTTKRVIHVSSLLESSSRELDVAGDEAVDRAQAAARALDELAATLKETTSPVERRFEAGWSDEASRYGRPREVCEWVSYATPSRKYRKPDLNWLVASAVVTFLENKPEMTTEVACQRVSGYLSLLDAPFGTQPFLDGP